MHKFNAMVCKRVRRICDETMFLNFLKTAGSGQNPAFRHTADLVSRWEDGKFTKLHLSKILNYIKL